MSNVLLPNGEVDWNQVETERGAEEAAIRSSAEQLYAAVVAIQEDLDDRERDPGAVTPGELVEGQARLVGLLRRAVGLLRAHLRATDLDDTAKAIGVSVKEYPC
jgi:hypothetical protein